MDCWKWHRRRLTEIYHPVREARPPLLIKEGSPEGSITAQFTNRRIGCCGPPSKNGVKQIVADLKFSPPSRAGGSRTMRCIARSRLRRVTGRGLDGIPD